MLHYVVPPWFASEPEGVRAAAAVATAAPARPGVFLGDILETAKIVETTGSASRGSSCPGGDGCGGEGELGELMDDDCVLRDTRTRLRRTAGPRIITTSGSLLPNRIRIVMPPPP